MMENFNTKINRSRIILFIFILFMTNGQMNAQNRWLIENDGILWEIKRNDKHTDHIELSGKQMSVILTYGVDNDGLLFSEKLMIFPMLRTIPNETAGHLKYTFGSEIRPIIKVNNRQIKEKVVSFYIKGMVQSVSNTDINRKITITRTFSPSVDKAMAVELFTIKNGGDESVEIEIEDFEKSSRTSPEKSVYGVYEIKAFVQNAGIYPLASGDSLDFSMIYSGRKISSSPIAHVDVKTELEKRNQFVELMFNSIRFVSPDATLNRMFDFAKIRLAESIYETKGGLVHGPGGGSYYAAIWANDQAEYANPFFGYLGYDTAIESAMVSWKWFSKWMNDTYKPIPSSIVAEGDTYWNGAGDRGDQAMIAYGATRFALALGDREKAKQIWPLIEWCLEYCKRKINKNGVVASDSDELENRFPSGDANLSTSSLYYDALLSAIHLGNDLGINKKQLNEYRKTAEEIHNQINTFFGASIQGFNTYRYYEGNDILRSWICLPLTVGIFERSIGTMDALFSPYLWTENGLLTQAGDKTFWDRSTLYGLRGAFSAGATEKVLPFLIDYSNRRLLGNHVPYAVEAWPEGNQRHLSAESALYCRVVTEGLFGFRPTGLNEFEIKPQLPESWNEMALENMIAFGNKSIDIQVNRTNKGIKTDVFVNGKLIQSHVGKKGETIHLQVK
ncbi:hypothetical protein EZS27_007053 [termite gut metagenome]|uniref:Alpha-L-rhamnosidase six-hairpin glycosidase domain-containing protein n=1 Tax=termite gut metagenome TaxID=433724 RepID=A0A5J4SGN3_9ZZZZ